MSSSRKRGRYIYWEIVYKILEKLPANKVVGLKTVSKEWKHWIETDPYLRSERVREDIEIWVGGVGEDVLRVFAVDNNWVVRSVRDVELSGNPSTWRYVEGVVCYDDDNVCGDNQLMLLNLTNGQECSLPPTPTTCDQYEMCFVDGRVKLVAWDEFPLSNFRVLRLGDRKWRELIVNHPHPQPQSQSLGSSDLVLNGGIYWCSPMADRVICFDASLEAFTIIPFPDDLVDAHQFLFKIFGYANRLCLAQQPLHFHQPLHFNAWIFVRENWVKMATNVPIPLPDGQWENSWSFSSLHGDVIVSVSDFQLQHIYVYDPIKLGVTHFIMENLYLGTAHFHYHFENHTTIEEFEYDEDEAFADGEF